MRDERLFRWARYFTEFGLAACVVYACAPLLMSGYEHDRQADLHRRWEQARSEMQRSSAVSQSQAQDAADDTTNADDDPYAPPLSNPAAAHTVTAVAAHAAERAEAPLAELRADPGSVDWSAFPGGPLIQGAKIVSQPRPQSLSSASPALAATKPAHSRSRNPGRIRSTRSPDNVKVTSAKETGAKETGAKESRPQQPMESQAEHSIPRPDDKTGLQPGAKLLPAMSPAAIARRIARAATASHMSPRRALPKIGHAVFRLVISRIGLDAIVLEGTTNRVLMDGPGHFRGTALPGEFGNCAVAGHENIWGSVFADLNRLRVGDRITVETLTGRYVYQVTGSRLAGPDETSVLDAYTDQKKLTLLTCRFHARRRYVVSAIQVR